MTNGGGRHPLQVMSILHNHYIGIAKLDGVDARNEQDAMAATGIKSPYPAKKALQNYQRLGGASTKRAVGLLAQADLDLRGARDLDPDVVMDVLVARLVETATLKASLAESGGGVDLLHQAALAASGLVLVNDALGGGHVEALDGEAQRLLRCLSADRGLTAVLVRVFSSLLTALLRSAPWRW